jgi:predicted nucleic acid-binding protein
MVDSGALIGSAVPTDGYHARARATALSLAGQPHVSPVTIVAEAAGFIRLRYGLHHQRRFWDWVTEGSMDVLPVDLELIRQGRAIDEQYRDLGLGFADAILLACCERERCARIFTFDRRLAAFKPSFAPALELIP